MKSVAKLLRYLLWATFTATFAWLLKRVFESAMRSSAGNSPRPTSEDSLKVKTLFRDPICGAYVDEDISHPLQEGRTVLHFCSRDCMEQYQRGLYTSTQVKRLAGPAV